MLRRSRASRHGGAVPCARAADMRVVAVRRGAYNEPPFVDDACVMRVGGRACGECDVCMRALHLEDTPGGVVEMGCAMGACVSVCAG